MTNGVKTRLLTPYVMICRIRKKKMHAEELRGEAERGSERLSEAQSGQTDGPRGHREAQTGSDWLREPRGGRERLIGAYRGSARLRETRNGWEVPWRAQSGPTRLKQGQSGSEQLCEAQRCPGGSRAAPRGSERKKSSGKTKISNFARYISWQMVSNLEFWHHLSWYVACKKQFFCKKTFFLQKI